MNIYKKLKSILKPGWNSPRVYSKLNLLTTFGSFKPHGNQDYKTFESLVIKNINEIIPKLALISQINNEAKVVDYLDFIQKNEHSFSSEIKDKLERGFNKYGSDKVPNNYHLIYSCLVKSLNYNFSLLEIGLGTNNPKIVSSMGINGKPGASIKAFRDTFSEAKIYGADFDKEILFKEKGLSTFFVDQNNLETLNFLSKEINEKLDFIIDDGLHYQLSNLNTLIFALENLNKNGYLIIEDIGVWTLDTWKVVSKIIPQEFTSEIVRMSSMNYIFIVKKIK